MHKLLPALEAKFGPATIRIFVVDYVDKVGFIWSLFEYNAAFVGDFLHSQNEQVSLIFNY